MDYTTIVSLIGSLGFPIVMCLIMFWYVNKTNSRHTEQTQALNQLHKNEIEQLAKAVENNTIIQEKTSEAIEILLSHFISEAKKNDKG